MVMMVSKGPSQKLFCLDKLFNQLLLVCWTIQAQTLMLAASCLFVWNNNMTWTLTHWFFMTG